MEDPTPLLDTPEVVGGLKTRLFQSGAAVRQNPGTPPTPEIPFHNQPNKRGGYPRTGIWILTHTMTVEQKTTETASGPLGLQRSNVRVQWVSVIDSPAEWIGQNICIHIYIYGCGSNLRARVTQVLVFGSIYQGAILVHVFEPQPYGCGPNIDTQNGTLVKGNMDQNPRSPSGFVWKYTFGVP